MRNGSGNWVYLNGRRDGETIALFKYLKDCHMGGEGRQFSATPVRKTRAG